ncbi:MAG: enoyl-CoA hydratase-related protein [Kofleriaceae bacterium]
MGPFETLLVQRQGQVLHVTLNQPHKRNAMSLAMVAELRRALELAEQVSPAEPHPEPVRVIVLRGAGGTFCAGGDLKDMAAARAAPVTTGDDPLVAVSAAFGELCVAYARTKLATVAVVEGAALGGGFGLACAVDVVLADETATFRLPEASRGLVPAQIAPFLLERLGYAQAKRLALTGAAVGAREARELGLVHHLAPHADALDAALRDVLGELLRAPPGAIAATKALLAEAQRTPASAMVTRAAQVFADAARGPEAAEGLAAFVQKRRPAWAPAESEEP